MSRRQIVAEIREVLASFRPYGRAEPSLVAAWELGCWAFDTVERPKVAVERSKAAAIAVLTAVVHAAGAGAAAALAQCSLAAQQRLRSTARLPG